MGRNKKDKNDGGLFEKPDPPKCPPHRNTYQNEHQIICRDCGTVVAEAPH